MTRIISLKAENVKRISAVEINANGETVIIGGNNAAGKTSVLDAIMYALAGRSSVCKEPIRRGESRAVATVELDDLVVTRTFTEKGSHLRVASKDGAVYTSGQKMLDALVGKLSFDPLAFSRMSPRDQAAALRDLIGVDHSSLDEQRSKLYADRTAVNREIKRLDGAVSAMPKHDDAPSEEVSVCALIQELEKVESDNRKAERLRNDVDHCEQQKALIESEIAHLESQLAVAKARLIENKHELDDAKAKVKAAIITDTSAMRDQIANAEATNRKVRENAVYQKHIADIQIQKRESDSLTKQIEAIDHQKNRDLAEANFPMDGLSFDANGVLLNGLPFEQASAAEQLRASVAIGLAMNPRLRVLLIRDASLLDSESLKMITDMASEHDAQLWVERVGDGDEVSVVIEDGHIRIRK